MMEMEMSCCGGRVKSGIYSVCGIRRKESQVMAEQRGINRSNKKKKRKLQLHGSMLRKKKEEQENHPKFPNFESKNAAATSRNIRKVLQRKFGVGMLKLVS
ncbi:unnamed protein product [Cuscuta campestris]|uniref:Uncharacterized protein n=1 Tax=Cuscuta campestris TaxID=132261 RepID=A0A484M405_9ASTE|nr:unnamed protein product [Cuscuta campestris]